MAWCFSAAHAVESEVRLYGHLFTRPDPGAESGDFKTDLNPNSLEVLQGCKLEPGLARMKAGDRCQLERRRRKEDRRQGQVDRRRNGN